MGHYKSNVRDLEFNLFEVFGRGEILGTGPFAEVDEDVARSVLDEMNRLSTGVLADSFEEGDRHPPVFDAATSTVKVPEGFKKSYKALVDGGWAHLDLPTDLGGPGIPRSLAWATAEMVLGANPALYMYAAGPNFAYTLWKVGTPEQKRFAELAIEHNWGATMVLTEPDAGSDVGAGRTKAVRQPDGTWHIEGVKRFITSAEHDMSDNIFHLVLARPEGHGPGTKGLSMFLVPKYHVDLETGELGERNGVYVTNVEKKMGLKVSTTCELTFGDKHPAIGWLVGEVHEGIKQMFMVIEHARMMVGTKAIATLSTGYLNALEYAKSRVQGADLARMTDKTAPRVTVTHHPDVRRELMLQKAYAEGMRALVLYTATFQDTLLMDPDDRHAHAMNDLLLPIVKGVGSERSYELLSRSLQTLGGSGYLQDYPIEQYIRDAKIDSLYEGTTAIQGQDLFFRKILRNQGAAIGALLAEINEFAASEAGNGRLKEERKLLTEAAADVKAMGDTMAGWALGSLETPQEVYKVGLNTTRLLLALGDLIIGWLLLRQSEVALAKLGGGEDAFYQGKVAAASFFAKTVLPRLAAERRVLAATDLELMELPEAAF
ncbi:acyl-CoA dehydrogenase [Nonomuraea gerenzanensis]|uniref:Broad-specificity linear acyl-CoA dehydrogenase FadE5 n=1 Tax=Nonomuraea gerenzanensis TaxID=93944 RepID=A0A1M4DVB2_9ACTN|nr:acyl-CoA dehydrogenase [Nonomuraea gerenzanensis]UBU12847.1 acyl-CoA dehydrogenase [Nonomuraea gerenzanensis]SBO90497.1 3-methylmercaptopropionyl-CoA dehydrogenase (DmdC) [Nonomuraea gerenzanensis]